MIEYQFLNIYIFQSFQVINLITVHIGKMILEFWKSLRLQNQLLIIQILFVSVTFIILISACLYLVQLFSDFIRQELLQQLVLNSVVSTIQTAIIRVDTVGMVVYNQFQAERLNLKYLYEFQVQNNIHVNQQVDDCLQSPHSQQFYSYQFCYGLYGQDKNLQNFSQIQTYTALQNQFIPFFQNKFVPTHYNIKFGKTIFLSQYQEKHTKDIDKSLLNALQQMEDLKSINYIQKLLNSTGSVFLSIRNIDKQLYLGAVLNHSENPYYRFTQSEQYFNQRLLTVLESGLILSDSKNLINGKQLQNTSVTGFNSEQFWKIKNFANKKGPLANECQFQYKIQILCLNNIYNKQQMVFSKYLVKSGYYMIVIVDTIFLSSIEADFDQQLEQLIDDMFLNLGIQYLMAFIFCIILQIVTIRKLNKPLEDLLYAANSHINNFQHTFHQIASVKETQNQTQKLADAFFNLINLTNNNKSKQQQEFVQHSEYQESKGTIMRRQSYKIMIRIRRFMFRKNENEINFY
ncbi:hypothetical protein pb186bvf_004914 [Paramecium bursaria]